MNATTCARVVPTEPMYTFIFSLTWAYAVAALVFRVDGVRAVLRWAYGFIAMAWLDLYRTLCQLPDANTRERCTLMIILAAMALSAALHELLN